MSEGAGTLKTMLARVFDDSEHDMLVVSVFDESVTYSNRFHVNDWTSADAESALAALGWRTDQCATLRCLRDDTLPTMYDELPDGKILVAGRVAGASQESAQVLTSVHCAPVERALTEYVVLADRVGIAVEFERSHRLHAAAVAAFRESERVLDWVGEQLIRSGRRPLNPDDSDRATPL